jgi:dihydropteroate synthase
MGHAVPMPLADHFYQAPTAPLIEPWPLLMGILNVTPDSFSDGGRHDSHAAAVEHAARMIDDGADILDVGGESTRPGAAPVPADEEIRRTVPAIEALRGHFPRVAISIDTMKADVAEAALKAGADIVNDVSAATHDPRMLEVCADAGCVLVLMHMRGDPQTMQQAPEYTDVVAEVGSYLDARVDAAVKAGVAANHLWIDPGFGFGKLPAHNFELVRRLNEVGTKGCPVLLGVSRKSSLGTVTGRSADDREPESIAAGLIGAQQGAAVLRVHEVGMMNRALKVARAILRETQ